MSEQKERCLVCYSYDVEISEKETHCKNCGGYFVK